MESFRQVREELVTRLTYLFKYWNIENNEKIKTAVRDNYSKVATSKSGCCCSPSCCSTGEIDSKKASLDLGYSQEDIESVPEGANMGLGCGNPKIFASLKKGETVLDLGSGGGFDCFISAKEVGDTGKVIGVDMTPEMVNKARLNAQRSNYTNIEFRLGEIEHLPVADSSIDVIISNCVVNLSTDKKQVFKDAYRALKKGGRLAISDVVKTAELPEEINQKIEAYTGCVSGASSIQEVESMLKRWAL
jgi:SAM-dependent methyltransferase